MVEAKVLLRGRYSTLLRLDNLKNRCKYRLIPTLTSIFVFVYYLESKVGISAYTLEEQRKRIGTKLGTSKKIKITQQMINQFAETTQDPDPMHIDPVWCKEEGPYPTTISFGFLTMSMLTALMHDIMKYDRESRIGTGGFPLNYGFNKLRLVAPVPVDSEVFVSAHLADVEERKPGQLLQTYQVVMNIVGQEQPALVGEWLGLWVSDDSEIKHIA